MFVTNYFLCLDVIEICVCVGVLEEGEDSLRACVMEGNKEFVQLLIEKGISVDAADEVVKRQG